MLVLGGELLVGGRITTTGGAQLVELAPQLLVLAGEALHIRGELLVAPGEVLDLAGELRDLGVIAAGCSAALLELVQFLGQLRIADLKVIHELVNRTGTVAILIGLTGQRETNTADLIKGQRHCALQTSLL